MRDEALSAMSLVKFSMVGNPIPGIGGGGGNDNGTDDVTLGTGVEPLDGVTPASMPACRNMPRRDMGSDGTGGADC